MRRLHRLGDQFMSDSLDGRTIAAELVPMATDWKEIGDMKSDRTLLASWRQALARLATQLGESERALREAPTERASVEATVANLGLNRRSTWA